MQRVSLGLGLGAAMGLLPGTGPIAALILAVFFKLNRAAAVLGSLLTNTWLSIVTFSLALRLGSYFFGIDRKALYSEWKALIREFSFSKIFNTAILKTAVPIFIGYIIIALFVGFVIYLISITIILLKNEKNKTRVNFSRRPER